MEYEYVCVRIHMMYENGEKRLGTNDYMSLSISCVGSMFVFLIFGFSGDKVGGKCRT